jgi:hypothetical protein
VQGADRNALADVAECLFTFGFHLVGSSAQTIWVLVAAAFALLVIAFHARVLVWFQQTHRFAKWHLFVVRFLEQCLCPVVLPMYGGLAGLKFGATLRSALGESGMDSLQLVLFLVALGSAAIIATVYFGSYVLCCHSSILDYQSLLCAWDALPNIAASAVVMWISFMGPVVDEFANWFGPVVVAATVLALVFVLTGVRYLPYQRMAINYVYAALSVCNSLVQVFIALMFFNIWLTPVVFMPLTLCLGACAGVITFFILRKRQRAQLQRNRRRGADRRRRQEGIFGVARVPEPPGDNGVAAHRARHELRPLPGLLVPPLHPRELPVPRPPPQHCALPVLLPH